MRILNKFLATGAICAAMMTPALAETATASPNGTWVDRWGTSFTFELCGDGTQLCGVLNDIQGDSRTPANLQYVNQEVVRADQTAPGKWEGTISLDGGNARAIVTLVGPDTLEITGCRAAIFCNTIPYHRS